MGGGPRETWDPSSRTFSVEQTHPVAPGLQEAAIKLGSGRINVRDTQSGLPELTTRMFVTADTEKEARDHAAKSGFNVHQTEGRLHVTDRGDDGSDGTTIISGGGSMVIGNISGGSVVIGSGEVYIGGRRIDARGGGVVRLPGTQKEVDLAVPEGQRLNYDLGTRAGNIEVNGVHGYSRVASQQGDVGLVSYEGRAAVRLQSGGVSATGFKGVLEASTQSGDFTVLEVEGGVHLNTQSGDITLRHATLKGANEARTQSGDIRAQVDNDSLGVSARSTSGEVKTPRDFIPTHDTRGQSGRRQSGGFTVVSSGSVISVGSFGGGGESVEGRFGQDPNPQATLDLSTQSGDIRIKH